MLKISFVTLVVMVVGFVLRVFARERAQLLEAAGGCINCHSQNVERDEKHARCRDCGFVGAADGGGVLSKKDTDSLYGGDVRRPFGD